MIRLFKRSLPLIVAVSLAAVLIACFDVPGFAQSPGDITVNLPTEVAVPGHLLKPGNYEFRRLNGDDPSIYEILGANGQFIGLTHVLPTERANAGNSEVTLSAPDSAGVRLVKDWYGVGATDGYQIVYLHRDVRKLDRLAQAQSQTVGSAAGQP